MSQWHPDIQSGLYCAAMAAGFAVLSDLSANRASRASWRKRLNLLLINVLCGMGSGVLITPICKLAVPHMGLEIRLVAAAFVGWFGLDTLMNFLKEEKERRYPHASQNQLGRSHSTDASDRRSVSEEEQ